jgi:murein DD-endopeptidase MepM/ murein hydrolase activator NlpD
MAGNRGIEYATRDGEVVRAIGAGRVRWVGTVARRGVITVDHPGGLRSSLVGVRAVLVEVGQAVSAGRPLAVAGGPVHLGVRRGERYLDPASLWGRPFHGFRAVLVPTGRVPPWGR